MKNRFRFGFVFVSIMYASSLVAQDGPQLNLADVIARGVENSSKLKKFTAVTEEAAALYEQAKQNRLPDFNVSGNYLRLGGADIKLPPKANATPGQSESPAASQAMYGIANLSLPLYAGGRIKYGIESARLLQTAAMLDAGNAKDQVVYNLFSGYVALYKAQQMVKVVKENLTNAARRDSNFIRLEANGLMARNDLLKAQLHTARIELDLLDAQNDYELTQKNLNILLGLPRDEHFSIDTNFVAEKIDIKNIETYERLAFDNRKDVKANSARLMAFGFTKRMARAEELPSVALTGGYLAASIPGVIKITNALNAGIGIQYNLAGLWKSNTKLAQVKAQEKQVMAQKGILQDEISSTLVKVYQDYLLSTRKMEVYERALVQAAENYRITNNKYLNNLVSITDLLEADDTLLQARLNRQLAGADIKLAEKKILLTAGLLN